MNKQVLSVCTLMWSLLSCWSCSFTAYITICNGRLPLVVAVLQLQLDPLGEVFIERRIQLSSLRKLKEMRSGSWSDHRGQLAADVHGELQTPAFCCRNHASASVSWTCSTRGKVKSA